MENKLSKLQTDVRIFWFTWYPISAKHVIKVQTELGYNIKKWFSSCFLLSYKDNSSTKQPSKNLPTAL